jgi:hypothetical protein
VAAWSKVTSGEAANSQRAPPMAVPMDPINQDEITATSLRYELH